MNLGQFLEAHLNGLLSVWLSMCLSNCRFICKLYFTHFTLKVLLVLLMIILMSFVTRKSFKLFITTFYGTHIFLLTPVSSHKMGMLYCVQLVNPTWHSLHIGIHFFPFMGSLYSFISNTDTANEITT